MDNHSSLLWFRRVAVWEGLSYIILLGIAMPVKYMAGIPELVKYVGWAHGILFMLYVALLALAAYRFRWKPVIVLVYFVASLLPFAPFVVERRLRGEESANPSS